MFPDPAINIEIYSVLSGSNTSLDYSGCNRFKQRKKFKITKLNLLSDILSNCSSYNIELTIPA